MGETKENGLKFFADTYIGWSSMIKAELWAIRYTLKLCKERNWEEIPVEIDSVIVVKLIEGKKDEENHLKRNLVENCIALIKEMNTAVVHVLRDANKCANKLAKIKGKQGREQTISIFVPTENLIKDLKADWQGTAFERGM